MDGISLLCDAQPDNWLLDGNLGFTGKFYTSTRKEAPERKIKAEYKGLFLSVVQGEKSTYCNLRGSVPMFYKNGETNAYDYTREMFLATIPKFERELKLKAEKSHVKTIEITGDVICPLEMLVFMPCVKCYKGVAFRHYTENGKQIGIVFEFQQYHFKIYFKDPASKLLRIEIAVKKMEWIKGTGIECLSDLTTTITWELLLKKLLLAWDEVVFIDKDNYNYKAMKVNEQKKFLRLLDASHWLNLEAKQQSKAKEFLGTLNQKYLKAPYTKEIITQLLFEKCQKLIAVNPQKGEELTIFSDLQNIIKTHKNIPPQKNVNQGSFNYLDKGLNHTPKCSQERTSIKPLENSRRCRRRDCRKSLNGKKATALFCSCGCKDKYYQSQKQVKARAERAKEEKRLSVAMDAKGVSGYLSITYATGGKSCTDTIHSGEITAFTGSVRTIRSITFKADNKPEIVLTFVRARQLVRQLIKLNKVQKQAIKGGQFHKNITYENKNELTSKQQPCAPQPAILLKQPCKAQKVRHNLIQQTSEGSAARNP